MEIPAASKPCALESVGERFAAAVEIVELGFGDRVVAVDGGQLLFNIFISERSSARSQLFQFKVSCAFNEK